MKTPIRTKITNDGKYILMEIQILHPKFTDYLEPIGSITFQKTVGEDTWYGRSYRVDTHSHKHVEKMAQIARFISKNSNWDSTPDDIKKLIGADEHAIFKQEFISYSKRGHILFDVIKSEDVYTRIIASSEKKALGILSRKKITGATLKFNSIIEF